MELLDLNNDDLLHILTFLNSKDAVAVSETCTQLQELCLSTPSLWTSFNVHFGQEKGYYTKKVSLTDEERKHLKISDDRLRKMHISVNVYGLREIDQLSLSLLNTATKKSNLQEFCFEAFDIPLFEICDFSCHGHLVLIRSITRLIENSLIHSTSSSARLRTLSFSASIPCEEDNLTYMRALLDILRSSTFYVEKLESFTLDRYLQMPVWIDEDDYDDNELIRTYGRVIGRFRNLQTLEISSLYLTDSLLHALSQPGRVRLQSMTVFFSFFGGPDVTSWPELVRSSPSLKVMVHSFGYDLCTENFRRALPLCVPIVGFRLLYDFKSSSQMFDMISQYAQSLETVAFLYSSHTTDHSVLLKMITQCSNLHTFYFYGKIGSEAILKIASFRRNWLKLGVSDMNVVFPASWTDIHTKNVERLCVELSEILGRQWKPVSKEIILDMFRNFTSDFVSLNVHL